MRRYILRKPDELRKIFVAWEACHNQREVARQTSIPFSTVQRFIAQYASLEEFDRLYYRKNAREDGDRLIETLTGQFNLANATLYENYAYILGMYLGDGHLANASKGVLRLSIALDAKYPGIIERCANTLESLLPEHQIRILDKVGCKWVCADFKRWHEVFPQHGVGMKHLRKIELTNWQQRIVDAYPLEFFRGLYHSDGSRSQNIVKGRNYPRYQFSNFSPDIRAMFQAACDKLGLHWTITNVRNVSISRRDDVAWLDDVIGPKI